ncbi:MAG TPA: glycosyltransferase family protein [Bacteroidales bacterium]|nr:glycosyltransferase family protein [Bacteroidales bacterium]
MTYLFIVQGEGRGHMTQAISLRNRLLSTGNNVPAVVVGKSIRREIPQFFYDKINTTVHAVDSPNFVVDSKNKKINIWKSIFYNLFYIRRYLKSLRQIHKIVKAEKPDVIINFYDLLGGLYSLFYMPNAKYICIGHQYLIFHPDFIFPAGYTLDKILLKLNNRLTSFRADKLLALSFREMPDIPSKKIYVVPPLIRKTVLNLVPEDKGYIHGYMLNEGYASEIIEWHKNNPKTIAHFFWDKKGAEEETVIHKNLVFHKINDVKFLDYMAKCSAYASTAGFESICEAMYLGKPILMVPTAGHYEQKCNALDAELSGAGISSNEFNLSNLLEYIPIHPKNNKPFKKWVDGANTKFFSHLIFQQKTIVSETEDFSYNLVASK